MAKKKSEIAKCPIYWISGNYHDCQKKWKELRSEFNDVNLEVLECGYNSESLSKSLRSLQAGDIIMLLKSDDLFDDRTRLLKIVGLPPDYTMLLDYLYLVDHKNIVIICSPIGYQMPSGGGSRFVSAKTSNFYKQLKDWGNICEFPEDASNRGAAIQWAKQTAIDLGKTLADDAAELLIELKGLNLDTIYSELSKLCDYQIDAKKIKKHHVEEACVPLFTKTTWDFIDGLDYVNYEASIEHLTKFFAIAGTEVGSNFYSDVLLLMGALRQHYLFLTLVKSHCGDNLGMDNAVEAVKGIKKRVKVDDNYVWDKELFDYNFVRFNMQKEAIREALKSRSGRLHSILLDLYRCDCACRYHSGDEAYIKRAVMLFVMIVCGKITLNDAIRIRGQMHGFII